MLVELIHSDISTLKQTRWTLTINPLFDATFNSPDKYLMKRSFIVWLWLPINQSSHYIYLKFTVGKKKNYDEYSADCWWELVESTRKKHLKLLLAQILAFFIILLASFPSKFCPRFERPFVSVNYEKWTNIRLTLETLTSSIMINELFIKILTIKLYNISHFLVSAPNLLARCLLAIDKTFLCVKNMEMVPRENFATQFLFRAASCSSCTKNIRFRHSPAKCPYVHVFHTITVKSMLSKSERSERKIHFLYIDFIILFRVSFIKVEKMNYFPYI